MNTKVTAIVIAAVVIAAGVGIALAMQGDDKNPTPTGYIIWEAQYSVGMEKGYEGLALTNDLFSGHTCCIIGASNAYAVNNANTVAVFLKTYSQAVDRINAALADTSSDDYKKLLEISEKRVAMPDGMTKEEKLNAIKSALNNVSYLYADDAAGNLSDLRTDVATLAQSLYDGGSIQKSATDLEFTGYTDLANKFVNDTYIKKAMDGDYTPLSSKTNISVSAIKGDIHQIAMWFAKDGGLFDAANLNVDIGAQNNGPAVYTQLKNGEADIGLLGAPPMTIRSMNSDEDIKASTAADKGLSIIGRVNSEGSGIMLKPGEKASDYITVQTEKPAEGAKYIENAGKYYVFNVETWGGKIFATPGNATIQHVQLGELAKLMGLKFVAYVDGTSLSNDTLYYMAGISSFADFDNRVKG